MSVKLRDALNYLLYSIFIGLARNYIDKLYAFQWILIVLLLLRLCFRIERDFKLSLSDNNQTDIIEAFRLISFIRLYL